LTKPNFYRIFLRRLNPFRPLRSQRGIALLIALFALTLMIFIATEVSYDTAVEYVVASQQVKRVKAYYAAKAGLELSLLRIQLYKQAMVSLGDTLGPQKSMLDLIWQFPMSWPPTVPDKMSVTTVDKDMMKTSVDESLMDAQYATTISPESGKLNINNLASEVKTLRDSTRAEILKIFDTKVRTDDTFRNKYSATNWEELVNNITDWISSDTASANGGDKASRYSKMDLKDTNRDFIPPGKPFKTLDELHMVAGLTDDFYKLLEPRITVYGIDGINVNYAGKEMLMSLDPSFTEEAFNAVEKRRNDPKEGGPFPGGDDCQKTFLAFLSPYGVNVQAITDSKIVLLCDPEYNFHVTSTGLYQKAKREITVITYDLDNLPSRLAAALNAQDGQGTQAGPSASPPVTQPPAPGQPAAAAPAAAQKAKMKAPKGRPTVVYWEET
jgi:general secretion pathway protein K